MYYDNTTQMVRQYHMLSITVYLSILLDSAPKRAVVVFQHNCEFEKFSVLQCIFEYFTALGKGLLTQHRLGLDVYFTE